MSPQKKRKSPMAKTIEPDTEQPSKTSNGSSEEVKALAEDEQGTAEGTTEEGQHDAQMGPATLESLEAREDFKRQLEAIMDATKVLSFILDDNDGGGDDDDDGGSGSGIGGDDDDDSQQRNLRLNSSPIDELVG